jgi:hypothetical protein
MKTTFALVSIGCIAAFTAATSAQEPRGKVVPLKEAKLNIEHNYTDEDTGFQGFVDSEGWKELRMKGPNGVVLHLEADGKLRKLGMTELFFETVEPENADVPINTVLSKMPAGTYKISGPAGGPDAGKETSGKAWLTHVIPKGPTLQSPANDAVIPVADTLFDWDAVTQTINNQPVTIIAYQLIVEPDAEPHKHMIGKMGALSMHVGPTVTQMTIPAAFFQPGTAYKWEVLAVEPSGNQTLTEAGFTTAP